MDRLFNAILLKGIVLSIALLIVSCGHSMPVEEAPTSANEQVVLDTIPVERLGRVEKGRLLIEHDVNLNGGICLLPKGVTLCAKGGTLRNGTIVGEFTKIQAKDVLFDKVTIKGSWDVPNISTKLFANLDYENSLRDVVALAHPKVQNRIVIEKGNYKVRAEKKTTVCIPLCSNTDFILKGTIKLEPNDLKGYDIIQVKGKNIKISGNGTIIGDKHTHTGTTGEWGMGIRFHHATNVTLSGLSIKDCWGDCIYVGGNSRNVLIEKCRLDHGRRQGISVTKANGVTIKNCTISNVSGTNPQYAIDVEPNRRDSVDNILIEGVTVKDCMGGFLVCRGKPKEGAKTPWIGDVTIRNCQVSSKRKVPIRVSRCEEVKIEKCNLYTQNGRTAIFVAETGKAVVQNNTASINGGIIEEAKNGAKKLVGKATDPIHVKTTGQSIIKNNQIMEH